MDLELVCKRWVLAAIRECKWVNETCMGWARISCNKDSNLVKAGPVSKGRVKAANGVKLSNSTGLFTNYFRGPEVNNLQLMLT